MRMFKNQNYNQLRKQHQVAGTLFEDPEFPANDSSLYTDGRGASGIEWKRPKDLCEDPKLVVDGVSGNDLNQGDVGNCWFVAACATLAGVTPLWEKVVVNFKDQEWDSDRSEKYTGLFRFHFWRLGEWIEVVVDDRLPSQGGRLLYLHSKDKNEFWSPLLEKAYAKLAGSYQSLDAGTTGDALVDFSGGVCEKIKLESYVDTLDNRDALFDLMEKEIHRNSMMSCSIPAAAAEEREAKLDSGLVKGHAYGITDVKLVKVSEGIFSSKKFRLLRIRNPWGKTEWNGAWSDESDEWKNVSAKERKRLGIVFDDDGEFWMSFDDFLKHYSDLSICRILNTSVLSIRKTWHEGRFHGSWAGARAGGCINNKDTFLKNPQYVFDVKHDEDRSVMVDLMQEDTRANRKAAKDDSTENANLSIGFCVFKVEENRRHRLQYVPQSAGNVTFTNTRSIFGKFTLAEGRYVCIPSTFQPAKEGAYLLRIYTEHASHAKELIHEELKVSSWKCCAGQYSSQVCVTVHSVNGLANQNMVSEGADPYCIVKVEGQTSQTPVIKDTLTAKFDSKHVFFCKRPNSRERPVKIEVWDKNIVKDKCLGEVDLQLGNVSEAKQTSTRLHLRNHPETESQGTITVTVEWFNDTITR